jgi:opacity protein-like surface antigen
MKRILLAATIALVAAAPAHAAETRKVCADSTYVKHKPGRVVIGTLFKNQTIKVQRYDRSRKYAYGFARGHANKHGWVLAADLCD